MTISIEQISRSFGNTIALDQVSFTINTGHIYGLLGNNGAGKSTLMSIITDRVRPDHGLVTLDGFAVSDNDRALGNIFMVGEGNFFPDGMRVKKALKTMTLFYPNFDLNYAFDLAGQFGLNTRKKITSLSTGYKSIFRLLLALCVNVPYLFLDEPVLGLDAQHRELFYRLLLTKFSQGDCGVVISTHLISEVADIIDHAFILREGKLIRNDSVDSILAKVYSIYGSAKLVDDFLKDKQVLNSTSLGGLKTAIVEGIIGDDIPKGLEATRVNLQDYFIGLMAREDRK